MIALAGAVALLYVDRTRRDQTGRVRQIWAKAQGYTYNTSDEQLPSLWNRAALAKQDYLGAVDVVRGVRRGEEFVLFDLEDTATIVAVHRAVGSDVDIDLRLKSTPPPRDTDLNLLGAIGPRVVFATDLEIARRVCDQRMVAFTESVPPQLQMLWSEGEWTLGSLPVGSSGRDWDAAIETVARLSGMLRVLPPATDQGTLQPVAHDPGRPIAQDPYDMVDEPEISR
ncbi:trehalose monomycolate transport factor TtfA [Prescottella soli]